MSWNDEKITKLKELWGNGNTASQIAEILGGVSRNAVIGKANRLNLSSKIKNKTISSDQHFQNNINEKNSTKKKVGRKSRFQSLIIEKDFEPENPKKLEELTDNDCKYPIGHPDEPGFYFCGRTSLKDFSYCRLHLLYSYQSRNKKEETNNNEEEVPEFIEKKIKSA
jgi:GcrA cell cycle regulator|tara:strand:- start:1075 stop:1575 length:501 start_codon:yes stop_codon:yes gene_type:complete